MKIVFALDASDALANIWKWNSETWSLERADDYLEFLLNSISMLAIGHAAGRELPNRPQLRYITVRRKVKGHGHIIVYSRHDEMIEIVHVFHTAQDWRSQIESQES